MTDHEATLHDALDRHFGFSTFRPGQLAVIRQLLAGNSAAAIFPTGGGKSLCYQLPAMLLAGTTIVVSPLIALMKDQLDVLQRRGMRASRLDSTLDADAYRQVMTELRTGDLDLLYVAPERFNNERFREALATVQIAILAIDEAHCVSEWGHNFRPDYLKLATQAQSLGAERVLALTATAPPKVLGDICQAFEIAPGAVVHTGFYRPNLTLETVPITAEARDQRLLDRLRERPPGAGIIYVTLRRTAERLAESLTDAGWPATAYHAGLRADARAQVQDDFLASDRALIVATIAFGMGIDKPNLRYVDHYDLPKSLEHYAQEIGRAGRDGEPSLCTLFACPDGLATLRNFAHGDVPDAAAVHGAVDAIFQPTTASGPHDQVVLDLYTLGVEHDIRPLVLRTLLTRLELDGWLAAGTPIYDVYRFKPHLASRDILAHYNGERRAHVADLLRQAVKRRIWFELDIAAASQHLNRPRAELVRLLDELGERGWLEIQASKLRFPFRILRHPSADTGGFEGLAERLHGQMLDLEARELQRLDQVLDLATLESCRWLALCEHFGEQRDAACGHCSWCLDPTSVPLPEANIPAIDPQLWADALSLRDRRAEALGAPRALARFLVGLRSPRLSRARLSGHPLFGALDDVPFATVLERALTADDRPPVDGES